MKPLEEMTKTELSTAIAELRDLLEEVKEEREMILGQENLHLSSNLVTKYADEITEIETKIAKAEKLLGN